MHEQIQWSLSFFCRQLICQKENQGTTPVDVTTQHSTNITSICFSAVSNQTDRHCSKKKSSFQEEVKRHLYHQVAIKLELVSRFVVLPSGIITNTVSFLVLSLKQNRKLTTCLYLSITAVTDNLIITRKLLTEMFEYFSVYEFSSNVCLLSIYIVKFWCLYYCFDDF